MKKSDKYILIGLWGAVGLCLVLFFALGLNIYAFLWFFVLSAAAIAWWGIRFPITEKMRARAIIGISGWWMVIGFLMLFPFPSPERPQYVVGEVHRFSEMDHGWSRVLLGVLGPNSAHHGMVYTDPNEIEGLGQYGSLPSFVTTFPLTRALFGGTTLLDPYRSPVSEGGDPVHVEPFAWTTWKGMAREKKLGWNKGDLLLGNVAKKFGYEKAKYTPKENALMMKEIALWLGSDEVGILKMDPRFLYSHDFLSMGTPLPYDEIKDYKYAIQVYVDQRWRRVHNDPGESWWSITKSGQAYSTSAWIVVRMAHMLRDMGYKANVGFGGINYHNHESAMSVYSGLGEYARLSDAVVPTAGGLRYKSASILTDFPMEPDESNVALGVTRFCSHCDRCARACPVNAIPMGEPTVENGILMWHVDKDKCARFRSGNLNGNCCNECLRVCPYNKPSTLFHKFGMYMVKHSPLAPIVFGNVNGIGLDDWLEFDYSSDAGKFGENRPARWITEEKGFKMQFPYHIGRYIFTEDERSPDEEWATGEGAEMGKVGLTYKGIKWGKIPERFFDADGRHRNVHWDWDGGELPKTLKGPGMSISNAEAMALLKSGKAFAGGFHKKDEDVYPRNVRNPKYEKSVVTYEQAVKMWEKE